MPSPSADAVRPPAFDPFGQGLSGSPFGGSPFSMFGGQGAQRSPAAMAMQLQQDPAAMAEMMASPMMQGFMNSVMQNPDMLRAMIDSNPGMRQVLDAHPELRHALADPETLRQSLAVLQNPELLREQMRSTDRALSNLEAHPEGFNALRRMYETVQEPLMAAAVQPPPPSADNPFASLFAPPPSTTPNTAPLPNPWAPNAGATPAGMAAAPFPAGAPAGLEAALAAALAGGAGQGGQHGAPNAALMEALFPGVGAAGAAGAAGVPPPEMLAMLQNPGMARALANPSSLQAMMQIQQAMATLQANGMPMPPGMMGAGWTPPGPQPDPAVAFASQLQQLRDMGFSSDSENLRALQATAGNVAAAVELLLAGV